MLKIGDTFKIRNIEITIKKGDYIIDNGSVKLFNAADKRVLYRERFIGHTSICLTKVVEKKINFDKLVAVTPHKEKINSPGSLKYYVFD